MGTFLFDKIVFGPVTSRRLGLSLGINLLPLSRKICNFDCIYCECGLTHNTSISGEKMPSREEVKEALFLSLEEMAAHGQEPDIITFAGNGEPTLHPQFAGIIDDTIEVKNIFFPDADIAVLTNATTLNNPEVCNALKKIDKSILKLDSAIDSTIELHNRPGKRLTAESIITALENFDGEIIVQTMFIRGSYNNIDIDNTTEEEIVAWLAALNRIRPAEVQIYTVSRDTPYGNTIEKVSVEELDRIAERVKNLGIATQVSG